MTPLSRAIALAILSAMILCAALAACSKTQQATPKQETPKQETAQVDHIDLALQDDGKWAVVFQYLSSRRELQESKAEIERLKRGGAYTNVTSLGPDTNFIARMEFVAARLSREELQNSNNWAAMRTILGQIDQRLSALEAKVVWTNAPMPAPLQSAPQVPSIEKEKP